MITDEKRLDDPQWVASELRARDLRVFLAYERLDPDHDSIDHLIYMSIPRWFVLGGGKHGEVITADVVNRGRLIEVMSL